MKIRRLLLKSFGCLTGEYHFSADRANLIIEPNERGKSTLASAILAGLYGFPPGQRRSEGRPFPDLDLHRPWAGGPYLVEMDVEAGGAVYTIRRDFEARREQVFEWRSGKDITDRFSASKDSLDFAGSLTGLDRDDFSRTAFLRQSEMQQVRDARGITAALQRMATSQQGDVAASEATEVLANALRQYRGLKIRRGKVESEIAAIEEEIHALREKLAAIEQRRREAEGRIRELESASQHEDEIDARLVRLEYLIIAAGRADDAKRLAEITAEKEELEAREREFQELSRYERFPAEKRVRLTELRARLGALAEEEGRIRERGRSENDEPLAAREARAREAARFDRLRPEDVARFPALETDLAAAWKSAHEARRDLKRLEAAIRERGGDPARLRSLASRFSSLLPAERRFLIDFAAKESEQRRMLDQTDREAEGMVESLAESESRTRRSRGLRLALTAAASVAAAAAFVLWVAGFTSPALAAGGAAILLAAARFGIRVESDDLEDPADVQSRLSQHERSRGQMRQALEALRSDLERLARKVGAADAQAVLEEFGQAEAHAEEAGEIAGLDRRLAGSRATFERSEAALRAMMDSARYRPRRGAVTPRTVRRFREALGAHRTLAREIGDLEERKASRDRSLARLAAEREALSKEVRRLLGEARMDPGIDLERAEVAFDEAVRLKERYDLLRKEVIPALVRRSMGHDDADLPRRIEATGIILKRKIEENPALAGLTPEKSHKEYIEERDRLRKQSREAGERRLELSHELSEVLREYRRDMPDTRRWLREWEIRRERAAAFRQAVEMARDVLEAISREAYAEWADVLNERASETLAHLVPAYGDLRFDETLSFSVRETAGRERRSRDDVDHRFSAGARDQIYLAARLAMTGYLSSGRVRLPLVLDDPFATFDDERFARAMSLMLEKFSRRHQLIILSCHEARHRAWQDRNPGLFADRVRIMSLQAAVT